MMSESDPKNDAERETEHDTVAQKPPDPKAGTPLTPPAVGAELDQANPTPGARQPVETDAAKIVERPKVAAGLPAVYETTRFAVGEMGVMRGAKALLNVNKKGGFDCQSCAWPSPDEHRQVAEFCENGRKRGGRGERPNALRRISFASIRSMIFVIEAISGSASKDD